MIDHVTGDLFDPIRTAHQRRKPGPFCLGGPGFLNLVCFRFIIKFPDELLLS
jgi:hypothetical protein